MLHTQAVELGELNNDESLIVPRSNSAAFVHSGAPISLRRPRTAALDLVHDHTAGGHVEQAAEREPTQAVHRS